MTGNSSKQVAHSYVERAPAERANRIRKLDKQIKSTEDEVASTGQDRTNLAVDLVAVVHVVHLRPFKLLESEVFVVPDQMVVLAHVFFGLQAHLGHREISQGGQHLWRNVFLICSRVVVRCPNKRGKRGGGSDQDM